MTTDQWEDDDDNLDQPMAAGQRNHGNESQLARILRDRGLPYYQANIVKTGPFSGPVLTPSALDADARERPESRGRKEDSQ